MIRKSTKEEFIAKMKETHYVLEDGEAQVMARVQ